MSQEQAQPHASTANPVSTGNGGLGLAVAICAASAEQALAALQGCERTLLVQLTGDAAPGAVALGLEPGAVGQQFELVKELAEILQEHAPAQVSGPVRGSADSDARATAAALDAALGGAPRQSYGEAAPAGPKLPTVTAVICTWNKADEVCANLDGLLGQSLPFTDIVVVDNASHDDTADRIRAEYPGVRLVVMPNSDYGACETFNIGFACARTDLIAILDDDVVLPPNWLEQAVTRMQQEPETTAVVSTRVVEPGMPESYLNAPALNKERYMSTFRGCASLARTSAVREVGGYDERLFIYGNERDMTCRLLNRGYRVLQYPGAVAFHKNPFGISMGKRSLFYHARNAWLGMLKYAPLGALLKMPFLIVTKVLLRSEEAERDGSVSDATGTLGLGRSLRETKGAWWVLVRAAWSVFLNLPYCMKHREPVRAADFELPVQ
ncbi:MAG: GT2 family glycosyltransferase [Planctomycetota bacterium]